jgi:hypothetical protein
MGDFDHFLILVAGQFLQSSECFGLVEAGLFHQSDASADPGFRVD